jgi:hypothetical protein
MSYYKNTHSSRALTAMVLMALVLGFYACTYPASSADSNAADGTKIVAVEEVLGTPEDFSGAMGVSGKVMNIDQAKSMFFLGCKTASSCNCAKMPVKYEGKMPEIGSDIIVFGEITTTDAGKFIFEGKEVKPQ